MCSLSCGLAVDMTDAQRAYQQLVNLPPLSVMYRQLLREFCEDNLYRAEFAGGFGVGFGGGSDAAASPAAPKPEPRPQPKPQLKPFWPPAPELILD